MLKSILQNTAQFLAVVGIILSAYHNDVLFLIAFIHALLTSIEQQTKEDD